MIQAKNTLLHINENRREQAKKDYFKTDNPLLVMQVETQITEVHLDRLSEIILELKENLINSPEDFQLLKELEDKQRLLNELSEEV